MRAAPFLLLTAACGIGLNPGETGAMDAGPVDGGPEARGRPPKEARAVHAVYPL